MPSRRPAARRFALLLGLGLACTVGAGRASGQLQTADPYDPYGAAYRGSTYPGYLNDPSFYNRPVYRPGPNVNQLEAYYRGMEGGDPYGDGSNRYDKRFRDYADMLGRNGSVDNDSELKLFKSRLRRDELFYEMQREKDPKKKAELSVELKKLSAEVNKDLARRTPTRTATSPPPIVRERRMRSGSATATASAPASSRPFVLPAFASFLPPERRFEPPASLPRLSFLGDQAALKVPAAISEPTRRPPPDTSPSAVLERATRGDSRRAAPAIPGLGESPR